VSRADRRVIRFVRALLPARLAIRAADGLFHADGDRPAALPARDVAALVSAGVLSGSAAECRATPETLPWLRRQLAEADSHAAQHRHEVEDREGRRLNLAESPLARLAVPGPGEAGPFLAPHQVEAGERVRRLVQRAQLMPRVTMSYDPAHVSGSAGGPGDIGDLAADARRALAAIPRLLPRDCADVVLDVCGLLKGLQAIETERGWPRRSAKLVLRIGLEQLATHYGLAPQAIGRESRGNRSWMEGPRPEQFE
jgi:hypothetical protein